ncbi:hypothetical protein ACFSTA_20330 [Ornithinibacillus salinisoli]|uniref:Uncharacterized protein n=1 Tax=Ornithinibacillus salinisoli TaxID=1848459 RepID=A0ABW4W5V6_9BACI
MDKNNLIGDEILFNPKPDAVPYSYRISYKLAQICLILDMCCGRSGASLLKIHMISVGLSTIEDMKLLKEFAFGEQSNYTVVRLDPAVNHAVRYALAEELLIQQKNGLFRLLKRGKIYSKKIKDNQLLGKEIEYLSILSTNLSEDKIKTLTSFWRYSSAEN